MNIKHNNKIVGIIYILLFFMMTGLLIYFGIADNTQIMSARQSKGYETVKDYAVTKETDADAPAGIRKVYTFNMPQIGDGENCLACYLVHQYIQVYIDDELVYSMMPDENLVFGKTPGSSWAMIPLSVWDMGKQVKVVITPAYKSFINRKVNFLIGSELDIYTTRLKKDMLQIIIGSAAVIVGMVFVMMAFVTMIGKKKDNGLAALGIFSLMLGLWRLTDTRFSPFIMPGKTIFLYYLSLAMLMLGCVPLLQAIKYRMDKKLHYIFDICCVASSMICMVQFILQITGKGDLRETLFLYHIIIGVSLLISGGAMIYGWVKSGWNRISVILRSAIILCAIGIAGDIAAFYIKGNSSGLLFTLSALLIYIIISGVENIYGFVNQEKRIKEQEAELAASRISVMLSQIQPHFLYNSLNSIYHLCDKNPEMAKKAISDFSDYLRVNLDSLKRSTPVEFEKELGHIKIYLALEKMRYDEELNIVYAIETTSFLIPALTVQPIVENAVKHGLGKAEKGGTVVIATSEFSDCFEVVVKDDGVGFDVKQEKDDGKTHIGIENVRKRLWEMSRATLNISSIIGKGTQVVIRLPKEGTKDDDYCS